MKKQNVGIIVIGSIVFLVMINTIVYLHNEHYRNKHNNIAQAK